MRVIPWGSLLPSLPYLISVPHSVMEDRTEEKARSLPDGYFPTNPIVCHKGNDKEDNIKNLNSTQSFVLRV